MAYADAHVMSARERSKGIAGVVAIHAGAAALLITGLTVTGVIAPEPDPPIDLIDFTSPPPPPPPEPVERRVEQPKKIDTPIVAPPRPIDPPDNPSLTGTISEPGPITFSDPGPIGTSSGESAGGAGPIIKLAPSPKPMFDPVAANPRNSPGSWINDNDYRSSWIRRKMTGMASFTLAINSKGRVTNCTVTSSTGYTALDAATCKLISRRARFEPARNSEGAVTSGTYSNSIRWVLPE